MPNNSHNKSLKLVSAISISYVTFVFILKIITVFFTNSISFFAEVTDSIMDFLIVAITYIALKISRKEPDYDHMFGHYKINSFAGLIQSILTILIYLYIIYESIGTIIHIENYTVNNAIGPLITLIIVIIMNIFISYYVVSTGKKTKNSAIKAQGVNFRGDLYRNLTIIIGLTFATFGFYYFDPIFALIFSIKSIYESGKILNEAFNELMDYNPLEEQKMDKLRSLIMETKGVKGIESISLRTVGNFIDIDLKISLNKTESLYSSKNLIEFLRTKINNFFLDYDVHLLIQIESIEPQYDYQELFDKIKYVGENCEGCEHIHGISLDALKDRLIVQFHLLVDPNIRLDDAHEIANIIEEKIREEITKTIKDKKIEMFSHIEANEIVERTHKHQLFEENLNKYKKTIENIISGFAEIKDYHKINILDEKDGIYLTLHIALSGELTVENAHWISEKLELMLKLKIKNLKRCIIHVEPIDAFNSEDK